MSRRTTLDAVGGSIQSAQVDRDDAIRQLRRPRCHAERRRVRTGMPAPPCSWRRALGSLFADYVPMSSRQAAETILNAARRGEWRVVIGQDAEAVDARVRADPWTAYD